MKDTHARWWAAWVIDAPWAHPAWSHYVMAAYDLTSDDGSGREPIIYMEGATHEVLVFACHPELEPLGASRRVIDLDEARTLSKWYLHPPNYAYQLRFSSDQACETWLDEAVFQAICQGRLNPDTDGNRQWLALFKGAYSLKNNEGQQPPRSGGH